MIIEVCMSQLTNPKDPMQKTHDPQENAAGVVLFWGSELNGW